MRAENVHVQTHTGRAVTINNGAQFFLGNTRDRALTASKVFTAISNTGTKPITGAFSNLADSLTFTAGNITFQASYDGGDGNGNGLTRIGVPGGRPTVRADP